MTITMSEADQIRLTAIRWGHMHAAMLMLMDARQTISDALDEIQNAGDPLNQLENVSDAMVDVDELAEDTAQEAKKLHNALDPKKGK